MTSGYGSRTPTSRRSPACEDSNTRIQSFVSIGYSRRLETNGRGHHFEPLVREDWDPHRADTAETRRALDTDCLNAASPWLSVVSDADPDPWNTRFWAGFLILLGIAIMLPARTVRKAVDTRRLLRTSSEPSASSSREWSRSEATRRVTESRPRCKSHSRAGGRWIRDGCNMSRERIQQPHNFASPIPCSITRPKSVTEPTVFTAMAKAAGRTPTSRRLLRISLLNGNEIKWAEIYMSAKKALSRRADWVVFVDARDNDLPSKTWLQGRIQRVVFKQSRVILTLKSRRESI